jgi:CRP/FNR family cyclic AMP-dependent transcriptional regulator
MKKLELTVKQKADMIDSTKWANEMTYDHIGKIAVYVTANEAAANEVLFKEGDGNATLILICKGEIDILKEGAGGAKTNIATLGPGKTIGEMAVIDKFPRSATAVVRAPAVLLIMTVVDFERLIKDLPAVGVKLVLKIARLMSQNLRSTSGRLACVQSN